jgi:type II secretory pathway pseudopilin PulG
MRRGFTLVEAVVAAGLFFSILAGAFFFTRANAQRESVSLDVRAAALRSAQIVFTMMKADVDNFVPGPLASTYAEPVPRTGVVFERILDSALPLSATRAPLTRTVSYRYDPTDRLIYRDDRALPAGPFAGVRFTFYPARPRDPTPPYGDVLHVEIDIRATTSTASAGSNEPLMTFWADLHSTQGTTAHVNPDWE